MNLSWYHTDVDTLSMKFDTKYMKDCHTSEVELTHWGPRQNGRHFADDTYKYIFFNETVIILVEISLKFLPKGPINNIPALVHIMAWRRPGDKPLSEPMMVKLPTHICITRPQSVKSYSFKQNEGSDEWQLRHWLIMMPSWCEDSTCHILCENGLPGYFVRYMK